jgi:hypothetical protein
MVQLKEKKKLWLYNEGKRRWIDKVYIKELLFTHFMGPALCGSLHFYNAWRYDSF